MTSTAFQPLVSIVIPVYNGGNYMRDAIDSALAQTYPNIEVIVVNDGSRDEGETDAIARSYGDRIRYFHKENGGCASALNRGIEEMRGAYFSWLSHDDVYQPDKVEHQIAILAGIEDKNTILYGGWEVIDAEGRSLAMVRPEDNHPLDKLNIALYPLLRGLIHGCSLLIPAIHFERVGRFDEARPSTQDYALLFEMLRVAPIRFDARVLIRSREHPNRGTYQIPRHLQECSDMWRGFLEKLTPGEMVALEGSVPAFLVRTAEFLRQTPYAEAFDFAEGRAREALERIPISVIMPFYNRVPWTQEAVNSVLGQTHGHLELLLVDDGSTDDVETLRRAIQNEPRVCYLRQDNTGPARARNYGLTLAKGDYVAFLDSDDRFHPEKLARQLWFMVAQGLELSHTSYQCMDADGRPLDVRHSGRFSGQIFPEIIESCPIAPSTFMGRADILRKNPFPEAFQIGEDVCWLIRLAVSHPIGGLDEPLTDFRLGPETAADNYHKQVIGLTNILSYVGSDADLVQCRQQIGGLLMRLGEMFDVQDLSMQRYQDMRAEFEELQRHHLELQRKYESLLDAVTHSRVLNFAKWLRGLLPHSSRS
jgi:glycosyltransferase involved in cell wall biosynthesis